MPPTSDRLPYTDSGTHEGDFRVFDWALLGVAAAIFGSAFMWIAIGLRSLGPGVIGFGRVALGTAALVIVPAARRAIAREDRIRLAVASVAGMGGPALLFAMAEQHIDSAVTGMLVSAIPLSTTAVAAVMTRVMPGPRRRRGLAIGLVGIGLLSAPDLVGAQAAPIGVGLVLVAITGYSTANNLFVPLANRYGPLPVTMWSLAISSVALLPVAIIDLGESSFEWLPVLSVVILGVLGTGVARTLMVTLIGRVGAPRGSATAFFVPITAQCHAWVTFGGLVLHNGAHPLVWLSSVLPPVGRAGPAGVA